MSVLLSVDELTKWELRFIALAEHVAGWSKDPSTQVGAVIVRPDLTVASVGYNGFPRGVQDFPGRLADRQQKYPRIVHAEANAIMNAKEPVEGYTLYVSPLFPCPNCAGLIIQSGITKVVVSSGEVPEHWLEPFRISLEMLTEAGVIVKVQKV